MRILVAGASGTIGRAAAAARATLAYAKSVEGARTGRVYRVT